MKFVRNLTIQLKPAKAQEFNRAISNEVLPLLKQQPGFDHELTMVRDNHAVAISIWTDKASAEKYTATTFPKVLERLTPFIEGNPVVQTYDLTATSL